jgi:putative ABC transport system permease protein
MNAFPLALRNLLRNRRRSLTTLLAMVIGLTAILLFGGYIRSIGDQLQTDYVQRSGHLQVQHRDYLSAGSANPAAYGVSDSARLMDLIRNDPQLAPVVRVVTPVLQSSGIAGNFAAGVSRTVQITGMVVDDQNRLLEWNGLGLDRAPGRIALTGTPEDSAVIGTGVARVLQLCEPLGVPDCAKAPKASAPASGPEAPALPSDIAELSALSLDAAAAEPGAVNPSRIEILASDSRGSPNVAAVKVAKAEHQGVKEINDVFVALHLSQAQRLIFGSQPPRPTALLVQLEHTDQMPQARARLNELLAGVKDQPLAVQDFYTLNPFYGQVTSLLGAIFGFVATLIGAIVLFTVGNTMSMVVIERTAEIGTLRAIGLRRSRIRSLFLCEGILLGLVGGALAVLVAVAVAWLINHSGLTWTPPGRASPVPMAVRITLESAVAGALGVVMVSALSALWPAARAARMKVVDALRHV